MSTFTCPYCDTEHEAGTAGEVYCCGEVGHVQLSPDDPEYDPTPWCNCCGAKQAAQCKCGPIAEND